METILSFLVPAWNNASKKSKDWLLRLWMHVRISISLTVLQDTTGVYVFIVYFDQHFFTSPLTCNIVLNLLY